MNYQSDPGRPAMTVTPQMNEVTGENTGFSVSSSNHFAEPVQLQEYQPDHLNSMQTPDDMIAESLGQLYPNLEAAMIQAIPQLDEDQRAKFSAAIESNDWDTLTPWFEEVHNNFDPSLDQPQQQQQAWDMETANSYWNTERTLLADVQPQGMEAASELMSEAEEAMSSGYEIHAEVLGAAAMFSAGQFESLASAMNQVMVKHGAAGVQAYHELFGE